MIAISTYFCTHCHYSGTINAMPGDSLEEQNEMILSDHAENSPDCPGDIASFEMEN